CWGARAPAQLFTVACAEVLPRLGAASVNNCGRPIFAFGVSAVREAFTVQSLARWAVISFLIAQALTWLLEIRAIGFREWRQARLRQSYFRYLASRSRFELIRLAILGLIAFAGCIAFSLLV